MSKPVLVTGATGNVGGAVARELLKRGHEVRAFVRDASAAKAVALVELGATLAQGDLSDSAACEAAATGVETVFIVTTPMAGIDVEIKNGKVMADAAAKAGVGHIVLSSVADAQNATGIPHFDSKQEIEEHLRTLGARWTSVAPVYFYDNLLFPWNLQGVQSGTWMQALPAERPLQMISVANIGAFVAHVIENPVAFANQHVDIAADELTGQQMAAVLAHALGRDVNYVEQDLAELSGMADMALMYEWFDKTGYSVDITGLKSQYPEVPWTSFSDWVQATDWDRLAS